MASLTLDPAAWESLRKILERVPEERRDTRWIAARKSVDGVTRRVRLEAAQWAELRRILREVGPRGRFDHAWTEIFDSVDFVCEKILDLRDMMKDPRPLEDTGDHDSEGRCP